VNNWGVCYQSLPIALKLFQNPERILRDYSGVLCFILALGFGLGLSLHAVSAQINPVADGEGYAIRGCALYGFLHAGEWSRFWELLTSPEQSICPLHYLVFFLVPRVIVGVWSYIVAQGLVTFLLLAYGIYKLCRVLKRPEWAPGIFLFCSVSNVALNDVFIFYLDMEFFAVGLVSIAFQVEAWERRSVRNSILSGLVLGLLFWVKPANALIFLATFVLSEMFHGTYIILIESKAGRARVLRDLFRHWGVQGMGFLPVLGLSLVSGGAQAILRLIQTSEVYQSKSPLDADGLLRLFYFPLCLSFFYYVLFLGVLLAAAFWISRSIPDVGDRKEPGLFPFHLFVPIALSYLIFGEFFSFWMAQKLMRSLLLMLPLAWIAFYWWGEKRRLRVEVMFLAASLYAGLAFSQKLFDLMGTRSATVEDTYQLTTSSWTQMPSPWTPGISINRGICNNVKQAPPPGPIICVNSIELQKLLTWMLVVDDVLAGKSPSYEVRNLFNSKGEYYNRALEGASLVILKTSPAVQSNDLVRYESMDLMAYFGKKWEANKDEGRVIGLKTQGTGEFEPMGYELQFLRPLTEEQVALVNRDPPLALMQQLAETGGGTFAGPHFSRAEAWELLKAWYAKRTGTP